MLVRSRPDAPPSESPFAGGVAIDLDHLTRYSRVCGFRLSDRLPATYPHVLAFPLSMALMARTDFPFPLLGLVHVHNTIEQRRPIDAGARLDLSVRAEDLREHERGRVIDVVLTATVDGDEAWVGRSAYLHRERAGGQRARREEPRRPPATAVWRVDPRVATDYARVSGDRNPIHTSTLGARLLGFPRRIAHGMWSLARCLAALEGRLPREYTVDAAFKQPILLPATVEFGAERDGGGWRFALHDARSGRPHLTGSAR